MTSSSPSRSRRENAPRCSNIGCMAGIFQLLSSYHSRRRFLTSGEKQDTNKHRHNYSRTRKRRVNVKHENKNNPVHKSTKTEAEKNLIFLGNVISPPSVAAEVVTEAKRRKLVEALEKCDEDLKAISSIISVLRSDNQKSSPDSLGPLGIDRSPKVSNACVVKNGVVVQQNKPQPRKEFFEKVISRVLNAQTAKVPLRNKKAKIRIVDEVCSNLDWGIDRELGKVVLVLEDHMFKYLIEEFINELMSHFVYPSFSTIYRITPKPRRAQASCTEFTFVVPPLPLEACKRRLSF